MTVGTTSVPGKRFKKWCDSNSQTRVFFFAALSCNSVEFYLITTGYPSSTKYWYTVDINPVPTDLNNAPTRPGNSDTANQCVVLVQYTGCMLVRGGEYCTIATCATPICHSMGLEGIS